MGRILLISLGVFLISASVLSLPVLSSSSKGDKNIVDQQESNDSKITEEEKKFVKEIEEKFNIKNDDDESEEEVLNEAPETNLKVPFPAVIAIEIVNDTTADGKGKRTIDANLGYGYKTSNGYFYSQFEKKNTENGKFMIYPYSQQDIPPLSTKGSEGRVSNYHTQAVFSNRVKGEKTLVEIQPSKAYQLVPIDAEPQQEIQNSYSPNGVVSHLRTQYENVQTVETPPPPQYSSSEDLYQHAEEETPNKVLYSTYNGGQLSGFSGNFPSVMSNYYVNPSKILNHPQYQSFGIHGQDEERYTQRRIIPVIILRIPSSQIQSPIAELYPKLPHSNPYATSLDHVNLQALVSQYLASFQEQYVQTPQHQPITYVRPRHRQEYSVQPDVGRLQYTVNQPTVMRYVQPGYSSYVQQQYNEEQPTQSYQYIHGLAPVNTYAQPPHKTLSQAYSNIGNTHQSTGYQNQDDGQQLQISENYPDSAHTRVILNSQYQSSDIDQRALKSEHQNAEYSTVAPVTTYLTRSHPYRYFTQPQPSVQIIHQGTTYPEGSAASTLEVKEATGEAQESPADVEENGEAKYETTAPTKEQTESVYNYHANAYPKRQVKQSDKETRKMSHRNRKIRSGIDTNI